MSDDEIHTYRSGDTVRFSVSAKQLNLDGTRSAADPATVAFVICGPGGTQVSGSVVRDATGAYHSDVTIPSNAVAGAWAARWTTTGAGRVKEYEFFVQALDF